MSRWDELSKPAKKPVENVNKIELDGVSAMCRMCPTQAGTVTYLVDMKVLTWKCEECGFINIIEEFNLV